MGDKDKSQKVLEAYDDVFADIINGLLFDGRPVAQEDEFEDATTWSYYKASGELRDQDRDIAKYWRRGNICISLVGLENQTKPDPHMPIRVMSYDAAEYRAQLARGNGNKSGRNKGNRNRRRYHTTKRIYPVLTLVVYLNHDERWTGPLTLKECLDIHPDIDPYIYDYGINLYEIAWMSMEEVNRRFHGDFRIVAEYYVQKRIDRNYRPQPQVMRHAREVTQLLSIMERDHRFEDSYNLMLQESESTEKGEWTMCDVLDRIENRGIERGREAATADYVTNMHNKGFSQEQISDVLSISMDKVIAILQQRGLLQA